MLGDKLGKKYRIRIIYRVQDMIDLSFPPCFTCLAMLWSQKTQQRLIVFESRLLNRALYSDGMDVCFAALAV